MARAKRAKEHAAGAALLLCSACAAGHSVERGLTQDASLIRDSDAHADAMPGTGGAAEDDGAVQTPHGDAGSPLDAAPNGGEGDAGDTGATPIDAAPDAEPRDAARPADASADARADARAHDGGPRACPYDFQPAWAFCLAAPDITGQASVIMQDTALGQRGDCAVHGSGAGGRNLYYRLKLPPKSAARALAVPLNPSDVAVIRLLSDCQAEVAETGARGFAEGRAELCATNASDTEREVILAVGFYSGEAKDLTLRFDLNVTPFSGGPSCAN